MITRRDPNLRLINASWGNDYINFHEKCRLTKETQRFDIAKFNLDQYDLDEAIPNVELFKEKMKALRISKDDLIVCYDVPGMFTVARCARIL